MTETLTKTQVPTCSEPEQLEKPGSESRPAFQPEHAWLASLLTELRGKGVTFTMRGGNRLIIRPWKLLTKDEATTVQANRAALKALVQAEGGK